MIADTRSTSCPKKPSGTILKWRGGSTFGESCKISKEVSHEDKTSRADDRIPGSRSSFHLPPGGNDGRGICPSGSPPGRASAGPSGPSSARSRGRQHGYDPHESGGIGFRTGCFGRRRQPGEDDLPGRPVRNDRTEAFVRRYPPRRPGFGHGHRPHPGPAASTGSGNTPSKRADTPARSLTGRSRTPFAIGRASGFSPPPLSFRFAGQ